QEYDLEDALDRLSGPQVAAFWDRQRFAYSHTPWDKFLLVVRRNGLPATKTVRLITLHREPKLLWASNHYEWLCHVKAIHTEFLRRSGGPPHCNINMTFVAEERKRRACANNGPKCGQDFNFCARPGDMTVQADKIKMFHEMGTRDIRECARTAAAVAAAERNPGNTDVLAAEPEQLERCYAAAVRHFSAEVTWVGVTERMEESVCLFHSTFRLPVAHMPHTRLKECRPIDVWSDADVARVRVVDGLSYAVHRAANNVLDARLALARSAVLAMAGGGANPGGGAGDEDSVVTAAIAAASAERHIGPRCAEVFVAGPGGCDAAAGVGSGCGGAGGTGDGGGGGLGGLMGGLMGSLLGSRRPDKSVVATAPALRPRQRR
ncbi:unnamed protein product, partial [Phaeothamnion confervicola]